LCSRGPDFVGLRHLIPLDWALARASRAAGIHELGRQRSGLALPAKVRDARGVGATDSVFARPGQISAGAYEVISQLTEISSKSGVVQFM
jgi:hypothetical protein